MEKHLEISQQFSTPEEEIVFLRSEIARREEEMESQGKNVEYSELARDTVEKYASAQVKRSPLAAAETQKEVQAIVLELQPETHDSKISEILSILQEKGVVAAIAVVDALKNPHIEDDFHRFLVQYIAAGLPASGIKEKSPLWKSLHATLFEVSLPNEKKEQGDHFKELVGKMEQFYAGMIGISPDPSDKFSFSIEIAKADASEEVVFYVSVPDSKKSIFEKQMLSIFPSAKIHEQKDDFNIFNDGGFSAGAYAELANNPIWPLRLYETFEHDPLNVILNAFSKIARDGEGASLQFVFRPAGSGYYKKYKKALEDIEKGDKVKDAISKPETLSEHFAEMGKGFLKSLVEGDKKKDGKEKPKPPIDEIATGNIKQKISAPIYEVCIRALASAQSRPQAEAILGDLKSSFHQFAHSTGNQIEFRNVGEKYLDEFAKDFTFRMFSEELSMPLNIKEITTFLHFPEKIEISDDLRQAKAGTAPAPIGLSCDGVLLGVNKNRGKDTVVKMAKEDRLRHMYVIGQTGTGKTNLLKNMIIQDIYNGDGCCFIDPHGSDIRDILGNIPKERYEDVIYFDPAYAARPMALNMLEYDPAIPEQKIFVVNELLSIFKKLYSSVPESMGPAFEQYFRNATMLVMEDPESGNTLIEISRVLVNKPFREMKLAKCKNPIVLQFWKEMAEKTTGEASLSNIAPYITNKFDVFLSNDIMRPIISQEKSSFNFRKVMDEKKILLVNLSKGRLGDINANLIGLVLVGKILMAALSRADSVGKDFPPFYLYIDEFQNITTDSISQILSEARKYKLSLTIAHQFISQLEDSIKDAVFGNVGSMAVHRVGAEDAEFLEKQFSPVFAAKDIMNLDNYNSYLKILAGGKPVAPFNMQDYPAPKPNYNLVEKLQELSYLKYGKPKAEVEEEVMKKYAAIKAPAPAPTMPPIPVAPKI